MINDHQQNVSIAIHFLMTNVIQQQFLLLLLIFIFLYLFFFFRHFYLSTRFISVLTLKLSVIHWLSCFRVLSGLFPVPFWKTWILVTVYKLCHVPHASRITTCGAIFTERHFSVSKEWVRPTHDFLITYHKTLTKKLFGGTSRKSDEKETKKKKPRMAISKLFELNANAIKEKRLDVQYQVYKILSRNASFCE